MTAGAAIGANGIHLGQVPGPRLIAVRAAHQRPHRTDLDTVSAMIAVGEAVAEASYLGIHAPLGGPQGHRPHHFLAHADTALALDATLSIKDNNRIEVDILGAKNPLVVGKAALPRAVGENRVLEFAFPRLVADRAIQGMIGKQDFKHGLPRLCDQRRVRLHHHAVGYACGAGGLQPLLEGEMSLDLHQAHAAGCQGGQPLLVAEGGNVDALAVRQIED